MTGKSLSISCDKLDYLLSGRDAEGINLAIPFRCMKPTCDNCWLLLHKRRIRITRIYLETKGIETVWVGLLDEQQRQTARSNKARLIRSDVPVESMLITYMLGTNVGVLATHNLIMTEGVMVELSLATALAKYYKWGEQYRPKRVKADWELKPKNSTFLGRFVASRKETQEVWKRLSKEYGYEYASRTDDDETFDRRAYQMLMEIRSPSDPSNDYP